MRRPATAAPMPSFVARYTVSPEAPAVPEGQEVAKLADLPLASIINTQGMVLPEVASGSKGAVFAIYDEKQKLQYIGISGDVRNAVRAVLSRRPEKAFFYKALGLPTDRTEDMTAVRDAWFSECGSQPIGNRLAIERTMWQQPVDAGAISERGRKGAAEEMAKNLIQTLRDRGCKEEFTPNPNLLLEGQVEFLPVRNLSEAELQAEKDAEVVRMASKRSCSCVVDGQERTFYTQYALKYQTNGGYMMDVSVLFDGRETQHRVIVGKRYYEPHGLQPEVAAEAGLALLLRAKVSRATEGMLLSSQFPVNYFALGQVEQWYGEEFLDEFERITGGVRPMAEDDFWRFQRIHDYGALARETSEQLNAALGKGTPVNLNLD